MPSYDGIYDYVKHFAADEPWGDSGRMNGLLIMLLDSIRRRFGCPVVIHCGTQGEHSPGSEHPHGNAVDFHLETAVPYFDQIVNMETFLTDMQVADRIGLGLYPTWRHPGFHLDVRGHRARWGWVGEQQPNGARTYCSIAKAIEFARVSL